VPIRVLGRHEISPLTLPTDGESRLHAVICLKQSLATARLELVILFRKEVSELQMGLLPSSLSWGAGYSATHLNLATQTVIDAIDVPAGLALLVLKSRVIGHIAFHAERSRAEVIWISYEVSEPFQNQGYASEAVPVLVDELLTIASVVRAEVLRGRAASIKVLTRAGLTKTEDRGFGEIWERRAPA
jgi:Acetyltransferase (GNAT) domain